MKWSLEREHNWIYVRAARTYVLTKICVSRLNGPVGKGVEVLQIMVH